MNWTLMFRLRSFGTKQYYAGFVLSTRLFFIYDSPFIYICPHTDLVTAPPTESKPIHKQLLYISARGHYSGKEVPAYFELMLKFPTTQVGIILYRYHASNLCMKLEFFIGQK